MLNREALAEPARDQRPGIAEQRALLDDVLLELAERLLELLEAPAFAVSPRNACSIEARAMFFKSP